MAVAIDFTASNKDRHKIQKDCLNDYETAIREVGKILEPYAYKQKVAGFGFGGIPNYLNETEVSHCFNLCGDPDPTITGISNLEL